MNIDQNGIAMIQQFEGLRLNAYQDSVGVWTIGYGHTGSDVKAGMSITKDQALALLTSDLKRFVDGVNSLVTVDLTQNQFNALVSFAYNLGLGNLKSSTLLKLLNAGDYNACPAQFLRWNKAGGNVLVGLTARRQAEANMFAKAD